MYKPFLKWAGSKSRIVDTLREHLPAGHRLIEPFLGSGAVFLSNQDRYARFVLNDLNPDLIGLFRHLSEDPERFVREAEALFQPAGNKKPTYHARRDQFNMLTPGDWDRALLFLYLIRHCFNGVCRYNQKGGFNQSFGRLKQAYFPAQEMRAFAQVASRAEFVCEDFEATMQRAGPGDVVYCDPPYFPLSETANFTEYTPSGFGTDDQERLAGAAREAVGRGAVVLISNHDVPAARKLYQRAGAGGIHDFAVRRSVSRNRNGRRPVRELLAVFRPTPEVPAALEDAA